MAELETGTEGRETADWKAEGGLDAGLAGEEGQSVWPLHGDYDGGEGCGHEILSVEGSIGRAWDAVLTNNANAGTGMRDGNAP